MTYYCIHAGEGREERLAASLGADTYFLRRLVRLGGRRKGVLSEEPVFPGLVLGAGAACGMAGAVELCGGDALLAEGLLSFAPVLGLSPCLRDAGGMLVPLSGPLLFLRDRILRADFRKCRATVRVVFLGEERFFDLGFSLV